MQCPNKCNTKTYIHGHYGRNKTPRYKCPRCGKTFSPKSQKPCAELNIPTDTIYRILSCLTEGCGVRATARVNGVHAETVLKVLKIAGIKASVILDRELRNIRASQICIDEAWTFVQKKNARLTADDDPDHGDQWVFLAITEDKLIPAYALGKRDPHTAFAFIGELEKRIANRFQLTSDGWTVYQNTIEDIFGAGIDYAQEIKDYGQMESNRERYSPSALKAVERKAISGNPDLDLATTAYIERMNLNLRTKMRRLTRLASGFSKKKAYLAAALALHIFAYDFLTVHSTISCTPAQQANVTNRVWNWSDLFSYTC